MTKSRIVLIALAICCIAMLGAGTAAYFTVQDTAYNVITTGILDMVLVEKTTDGAEPGTALEDLPAFKSNENGAFNVMPGETVSKIPYVDNNGTADFYTRMQLTQSITVEGNEMPTTMIVDGEEIPLLELDISPEWKLEDDGWYYYAKAVAPESRTEPLFTGVTFVPGMGNEYQNATVTIEVVAQAVQSKNNGTSAQTAAGWPVAETDPVPGTDAE